MLRDAIKSTQTWDSTTSRGGGLLFPGNQSPLEGKSTIPGWGDPLFFLDIDLPRGENSDFMLSTPKAMWGEVRLWGVQLRLRPYQECLKDSR